MVHYLAPRFLPDDQLTTFRINTIDVLILVQRLQDFPSEIFRCHYAIIEPDGSSKPGIFIICSEDISVAVVVLTLL